MCDPKTGRQRQRHSLPPRPRVPRLVELVCPDTGIQMLPPTYFPGVCREVDYHTLDFCLQGCMGMGRPPRGELGNGDPQRAPQGLDLGSSLPQPP